MSDREGRTSVPTREQTEPLGLLGRVAAAGTEASTVSEALRTCLGEVCSSTGWPVGWASIPDMDAVETVISLSSRDPSVRTRAEPFELFTDTLSTTRLLHDRAASVREPVWIADLREPAGLLPAEAARSCGLTTAVSAPVIAGDHVMGLMHFFSPDPTPPDENLLHTLGQIGAYLGRVAQGIWATAALEESRAQSRAITETALDAYVQMDASGAITDWNRQAEVIFDWQREEVLGRSLAETMIPLRYRQAHQRGLKRFLETGEGPVLGQRLELAALRRDGSEIPVELALWPTRTRPTRYFHAFVHDITERKQAEEALTQQADELRRAYERLRAADGMKRSFVMMASHELRTPLTSVLGFSSTLLGHWERIPDKDKRRQVALIAQSARALHRLIEDLLVVTRVNAGVLEPSGEIVDVVEEIRQAVAEVGNLAADIEIRSPERLRLLADADHVRTIVRHLIDNAVRCGSPPVNVEVIDAGDAAELRVWDCRPGISDRLDSSILEHFDQRLTSDQGLGPGLSVVRALAEVEGGAAWSEPRSPQGACFAVRLRKAPREEVLVVEDDPATARLLIHVLERGGYRAEAVARGSDALAFAEERDLDLVILDLGLPDLDGTEVIHGLRRGAASSVPILVVTGRTTEAEKVEALGAGADDYLTKPFDVPEVLARVRAALGRRPARRSNAPLFRFGELEVDLGLRLVQRQGRLIGLTPMEYELLRLLVTHAGVLVKNERVADALRAVQDTTTANDPGECVRRLRSKLGDPGERPLFIKTEPGLGYRWLREPDHSPQ